MVLIEKITCELPVLYVAIIDNDLVDEKQFESRTEFIEQAVKEKLERLQIKLEPRTYKTLSDWWDSDDDPKPSKIK
jgi:Arc/MetJ-type ribon-helix-helix transcriptional regulator